MPIVSTNMSQQMRLNATTKLITGDKLPDFVSAVSSATSSYLLSSAVVNSTNICLGPGAGTFTGTVKGIIPLTMAQLMTLKATTLGITGRDASKFFEAISFGVSQILNGSAIAQGFVIGAGPGTGTGRIYALVPTALQSIIIANLAAKSITGEKLFSVTSAIAFGICNHIMSAAVVTTTCVGVAAGPPAGPVTIPAAPGTGRLY